MAHPPIETSDSKPDSRNDSREKLIAAAIRLFAQQGFDGTSVKELAEAAGVNVSLVSYHFGGKEGLLRTCLLEFGNARLEVSQKLTELAPKAVLTREEMRIKLTIIAQEILRCHCEQNDLTQLVHRTMQLNPELGKDIFAETFAKSIGLLVKFFENAHKHKVIRAELNPRVAAHLFMGNLIHLGCSAKVFKSFLGIDIENKKEQSLIIQNWIRIYLEGAFADPAQGTPS